MEVPIQVEFEIPKGLDLTPTETAKIMKFAMKRYSDFMQRRFDNFSKGEGNWKPLAKSTLRARDRKADKLRKGKKKTQAETIATNHSILRDDGILMNAMVVDKEGNGKYATVTTNATPTESVATLSFKAINHPPPKEGKKKSYKGITMAALAAIQHYGSQERNIPARPILVEPNAEQTAQLESLIARQVKKAYETR